MNEIEEWNMRNLVEQYSNICISIDMFVDFLKPPLVNCLDPITDRKTLQRGLYARCGGANIWVSKIVRPRCVRFSNLDIYEARKEENKWSSEIPLALADVNTLDRMMKLKVFW
jgi:hypothetical protein